MRLEAALVLACSLVGCVGPTEVIAVVDGQGGGGGTGGSGGAPLVQLEEPAPYEIDCGAPTDVAGGAVDAGSDTDLLSAGECLSVLRGSGDGAFSGSEEALAAFGEVLALGRVTGPPDDTGDPLDVIGYGTDIQVLQGDGTGGFQLLHTLPIGSAGVLSLGDLVAPSALDLVVGSGIELRFFENDGHGAFSEMGHATLSSAVRAQALADFDGDAHLDVIVSSADGIAWLRNEGGGMFAAPVFHHVTNATAVVDVTAGHLDADDCPDAVAIDGLRDHPAPAEGQLRRLINACDGTGTLNEDGIVALPFATAVELGDVTGDGITDVIAVVAGDHPELVIFPGHASGLHEAESFPLEGEPRALTVLDLDADGRQDIVVAAGTAVVVLLNAG